MKKTLNIFIMNLSIIFLLSSCFGLDIPLNNDYILDQSNILTLEQEQILENTILNSRKTTDIEIGILIINSLEGEDIFNYSLNVAEARGIGDKNKDNGLFLLFVIEDRERRIQVGYGLEGIITDNIAKRLGEKNIPDNFRQGLYFNGINNTLQDIINYINKDPETLKYINANTNILNPKIKTNSDGIEFIFFIFLYILTNRFILTKKEGKNKRKITKKGRLSFLGIGIIGSIISYLLITGTILFAIIFSFGGLLIAIGLLISGGTGLFFMPGIGGDKGGFGSGSFGGFGGGGFGGGGAGGKR